MRFTFFKVHLVFLCILAFTMSIHAIGQSAVITLIFPPGARATGLGEAFVAVADDANATFYNPAGLGQQPLSNAWKAFPAQSNSTITAIASKSKVGFGSGDKIWAGTNKGILRFNGKTWESYERHLISQGENLSSIAHKYLTVEDNKIIEAAVTKLKSANGIEAIRTKALQEYLQKEITDSLLVAKKTSRNDLVSDILNLSKSERSSTQIYGKIASRVDSLKANKMSDDIATILTKKDSEFDELVELKIPFAIAVDDSVTSLAVDSLDRLWIGTPNGLWRYDGTVWTPFTIVDGLPSNNISSIAISHRGDVAIGTNAGIGTNSDGKWKRLTFSNNLPDSSVKTLVFDKNDQLYVGTAQGLARQKDSAWVVFDTSNGLINNNVKALFVDSKNKIWVGGENGVSIFNETSWKRYKFPGSTVSSIMEHQSGTMWLGTNKGAISYRLAKPKVNQQGIAVESTPEWRVFHSKNALKGDDVRGISVQGSDIWLATTSAVNQYDYAERQFLAFYELLLPAFKIPDLWHFYGSLVVPTEDWGTLGFSVNFINFGTNEITDEQGKFIRASRSWEGVFGVSYGLLLAQDLSAGINIKYAHSALAPGIGSGDEGTGRTFAIDLGLLQRNFYLKNFDVGFNLQNMGPSIYYMGPDQQDPIPFTVKLGAAYRALQTPFHDLKFLLDLNREIVKNTDKGPDPFYKAIFTGLISDTSVTFRQKAWDIASEVNVNVGMEYWYANFFALRLGHLFDYIGKRFELTFGIGIKYGNLNFDWSFIYSPEGFEREIFNEGSNGSRDGQWRASLIYKF